MPDLNLRTPDLRTSYTFGNDLMPDVDQQCDLDMAQAIEWGCSSRRYRWMGTGCCYSVMMWTRWPLHCCAVPGACLALN